jgi:Rho-binding antiterminator
LSEPYQPVHCGFHDVLEDAAVRGRTCRIRYRGADGTRQEAITTIRDVFTRNGAEYASLGTDAIVRLDRLDGVEPVDGL